MKLFLKRVTSFGTTNARKDFLSFTFKTIIYILVALILGHYTDKIVLKCRTNKIFGKNILYYILLQTAINIVTLYLLILLFPSFISEFQTTISGLYFVTLYFAIQKDYITMLQQYMNRFL